MLEKLIQEYICIDVFSRLNTDTHTGTVGFIPKFRDAVNPLILYQLGDLLNESRLIYHIRKLADDDPLLSVVHRFNIGHGADFDLATAGTVRLLNLFSAENRGSRRKIRTFYDLHQLVDVRIPVFLNLIIDNLYHAVDGLPQIVRRNIGRHTDSDSLGAVDHEIRKTGRKHRRLLLRLVKVRRKIYRVFINICRHLHGDLRQTCLRVTHGRCPVSVHGTEVAVSVHQRVSGRPFLGQINKSAVDGAVSVRVIFTHGIADDTGTFSVRLIRTVVQLNHGIKNPSLHRLETVPHIRKSP